MTIRARVDAGSLTQSPLGSITGTVYWDLDGISFPDDQWSDFVVVILGWWIGEANRLLAGQRHGRLSFMDGPYQIEVQTTESPSRWSMQCLRSDKPWAPLAEWQPVESMQVIDSLADAARQILTVCDRKDIDNVDVRQLRAVLATLDNRQS